MQGIPAPNTRLAVIVALALALALAGCAGSPEAVPTTTSITSSTVTASPPTTPSPTTVVTPPPSGPTTGAAAAEVGELAIIDAALAGDGTLDPDAALELFAAGFAPLPGITPAPSPPVDGGPVLRSMLAGADRLGAEQRAALERVTSPTGVILDDVTAATATPRLAAAADVVRAALGRWGGLPADVRVSLVELPYDNGDGTFNFSSPQWHALALPFGDAGVEFAECRIRVNATSALDATLGLADPAFVSTVAAEAYHCVQHATVPALHTVPLWVVEGAAGFAGEDVAEGSPVSAAWWARWAGEPQRPLGQRTADAIGFFSMVAESADTYAFATAFLSDPGSVRRRLEPTDLFDRWGLHYATEPSWGAAYTFVAPGVPVPVAPQQPVELTVDGPAVVVGGAAVSDLAAFPARLTAPGDVLVVTSSPGDRGGLRWADGQEVLLTQATQSFCLLPAGCVCPGTAPDDSPATPVASADLFVGVGPSAGGGPELAARSLGRWCGDVALPPPPAGSLDPCLARTWTSTAYVAPEVPGVALEVGGGEGAVLDLRSDGTARVDVGGAAPVTIMSGTPDGTVTTTTLQYRGAGAGTWSAADGVVDVTGIDPSSFAIRVTVESSTGGLLIDSEIPLTDVRLSGYGNVLGTGRYECTAVSLVITHVVPGVGGEAGFTFSP